MPPAALLVVAVLLFALGVGVFVWGRRGGTPGEVGDSDVIDAPRQAAGTTADRHSGLRAGHLLAEPPMVDTSVGEVTLRDWLLHFSGHDLLWPRVASAFNERAAADPAILSYFTDGDLFQVQRHFIATLVLLTGDGISVGTLRAMRSAHSPVRNARGEPITGIVYDAATAALFDVLVDEGVPDATLDDLAGVVAVLRNAIASRAE